MVIISYRYFFRRYSRRTHHNKKPLTDCIFCHRNKNLVQIFPEADFRETLMSFITHRRLTGIIAPIRVHVHTNKIHTPPCSQNLINQILIISQTTGHIVIIPRIVIKERTISLTKTMQIHNITLRILQIPSYYIQDQRCVILRVVFLLIFFLGNNRCLGFFRNHFFNLFCPIRTRQTEKSKQYYCPTKAFHFQIKLDFTLQRYPIIYKQSSCFHYKNFCLSYKNSSINTFLSDFAIKRHKSNKNPDIFVWQRSNDYSLPSA